jgi:TRAP-type C4-dicarboxylate transport system permease small subunit
MFKVKLDKLSNYLNKWFCRVGGTAIVAMTGLACSNIFLRLFGQPWKGTYEVVGLLGALVFAFGLGHAQLSRSHISVDIMDSIYSSNTRKLMNIFGFLLSFPFFSFLAWRIFLYANLLMQSGEKSDTLRIIFYPVTYGVAFCFGFFAFVLFVGFLNELNRGKRRK